MFLVLLMTGVIVTAADGCGGSGGAGADWIFGWTAAGALIAAGTGAAIAAAVSGSRWDEVKFSERRVRVGLIPLPGGIAVKLAVPFRSPDRRPAMDRR